MNTSRRLALIGVLLTVLSVPVRAVAGESWPEMPMPPQGDVQWIAKSMRVNGAPTRVQQFQSRASRSEVVDFYRSHWTGGGYDREPSVRDLGDATVVGQKFGPYLLTVKVEDTQRDKTSHGLISVARVVGSKPDRSPGAIALMPGAQVVSVIESDDPGKHSRQVMILSPQQPASVIRFYESSLGNAGWRPVQGTTNEKARSPSRAGAFMAFARDGSEMQLTVVATPQGRGTTLLANHVTNDTGRGAL